MIVHPQGRRIAALAPVVVAGVAAAVVLFDVPLRSVLAFGLVLLCPLTMLLIHGGHGGHQGHGDEARPLGTADGKDLGSAP